MRYKITIPPSETKYSQHRGIIVTKYEGFSGYSQNYRVEVPENLNEIDIDIEDKYQYIVTCKTVDAPMFDVQVQYCNETKTRINVQQCTVVPAI